MYLSNLSEILNFYLPWNHQKTYGVYITVEPVYNIHFWDH